MQAWHGGWAASLAGHNCPALLVQDAPSASWAPNTSSVCEELLAPPVLCREASGARATSQETQKHGKCLCYIWGLKLRPEVLEMQGGRWEEGGRSQFPPRRWDCAVCLGTSATGLPQLLPSNPESLWWVIDSFIMKQSRMESDLHWDARGNDL